MVSTMRSPLERRLLKAAIFRLVGSVKEAVMMLFVAAVISGDSSCSSPAGGAYQLGYQLGNHSPFF